MNHHQSPAPTQSQARELALKADLMKQSTRILLLALIVSISLWTLWLSPPPTANPITIWLIQVIPLLLFVPGVFLGKPRVHIWLCFVILVYFCGGVIYALSPIHSLMGITQSLLTMALFASAMMYVRWRSQAIKARANQSD